MNRMLKDIVSAKKADLSVILSTDIRLEHIPQRIPFRQSLLNSPAPALICEIKKASPSQGIICEQFDPAVIADEYATGGAAALSVLTDVPFFQGAPENISLAKHTSGLPALCKDFFIDPAQVSWAKRIGADAILLIMRILSDSQAEELLSAAGEEGLDALVETHSAEDIERAARLDATLIGINNRDLDTFEVRLETAECLRGIIPDFALAVAESGIEDRADIVRLQKANYHTFLVGGSLMRATDRACATQSLRGELC